MMVSRPLSSSQNAIRKQLLAALYAAGGEISHFERFTVVSVPVFEGSRMAHFAISYRAEHEPGDHPEVGTLAALRRLFYTNESITLPASTRVDYLAEMLQNCVADSELFADEMASRF